MSSSRGVSTARPITRTTDGAVSATPCAVTAVSLAGSGGAGSVILYDDAAAATGTKIATLHVLSGDTVNLDLGEEGGEALVGVFADLTGTVTVTTYIKR